jgi:hypothetical protein
MARQLYEARIRACATTPATVAGSSLSWRSEVAGPVVLEGDATPVVGVMIGLDHEPLAAPEEVDGPATDANVDLRTRDPVALAKA